MDCCTMDKCIAPYEVHYIGGRDPPRVDDQGGRHLREVAPPETLMGCLPCNPNGSAPGEAAILMGLHYLYRIGGAGPPVLYNIV
jgi:hypothetical protein